LLVKIDQYGTVPKST